MERLHLSAAETAFDPARVGYRSQRIAAMPTTVETRATATGQSFALDPSQLLTPHELATRLKVPVSWVYEKTRRRSHDSLPTIRLGKYLRFHWPDVAAWVERHRTNGQESRPNGIAP